jgi:hypothetical protein
MTPEELELIPGVTPDSVAQLGAAVNSFYGHEQAEAPSESPVETEATEAAEAAGTAEAGAETVPASLDPEPESLQAAVVELSVGEAGASPEIESDTIENSGLPRAGSSEN